MSVKCLYYGCDKPPKVRVTGGMYPHERVGGWTGQYCKKHAMRVTRTQFFQVVLGMPIKIEAIKS